ncbi:hypothetical protein ACLB1N_22605 [Escherichia coli]
MLNKSHVAWWSLPQMRLCQYGLLNFCLIWVERVGSKCEQRSGTTACAQLNERILVLDGGMGTVIQSYRLNEADFTVVDALPTGHAISKATTCWCSANRK